jgi:GTPase SAR1 family protein
MQGVPIVIIANKQDLPNSINRTELVEKLKLNELKNKWFIQLSSAIKGVGIYESMHKLSDMIKDDKKNNEMKNF